MQQATACVVCETKAFLCSFPSFLFDVTQTYYYYYYSPFGVVTDRSRTTKTKDEGMEYSMTVYDLFLGRFPYFSPDLCILVLRTQKWPIHRGIQRGNFSNTTEAVVGVVVGPSSSTQVGANTSVVGFVRLNSSSSLSSVILWLPYSLTIKLLFEPTHHMLMSYKYMSIGPSYYSWVIIGGLMGIIAIKSDQINDPINARQSSHQPAPLYIISWT